VRDLEEAEAFLQARNDALKRCSGTGAGPRSTGSGVGCSTVGSRSLRDLTTSSPRGHPSSDGA
jgi:hypothetical protein